jgi:chromosome segregation ATPase
MAHAPSLNPEPLEEVVELLRSYLDQAEQRKEILDQEILALREDIAIHKAASQELLNELAARQAEIEALKQELARIQAVLEMRKDPPPSWLRRLSQRLRKITYPIRHPLRWRERRRETP